MGKYYVSNYLNIISLPNSHLLLNGVNGCIDEISNKLGYYLKNDKKIVSSEHISDAEIAFLVKRGHLTALNKKQEKKLFIKFVKQLDDYNMKKYHKRGSLMLLLTYDCNLNCHYCYQKPIRNKKSNNKMTIKFIDSLFNEYFDKLFGDIPKKRVNITLYGGEPFLKNNRNIVEHILKYSKNNYHYVGAISNCTQIEYYKDLLGPLPGSINFIQVSIDGDQTDHDNSRIYNNGTPTFKTILHNIHLMLERKVKLNIRINIDSNSLEKVDSLYELLKQEDILDHPYSYVYLHPLHNHFNQTNGFTFLSHEETARKIKNSERHDIRHPIKRKADQLSYLMNLESGIAFKKTRFCMQNIPNNYLIDPYGHIYGCYEEAGRDTYKIGELYNGKIRHNSLKNKYINRSILKLDKCLECSVALLCGGECSIQARENNGDIYIPYCSSRKQEIYEALKYLYLENDYNKSVDQFSIIFPNL